MLDRILDQRLQDECRRQCILAFAVDRRDDAERIVLNLSAFLRHTLTTPPDRFVPLKAEIEVQRMWLHKQAMWII